MKCCMMTLTGRATATSQSADPSVCWESCSDGVTAVVTMTSSAAARAVRPGFQNRCGGGGWYCCFCLPWWSWGSWSFLGLEGAMRRTPGSCIIGRGILRCWAWRKKRKRWIWPVCGWVWGKSLSIWYVSCWSLQSQFYFSPFFAFLQYLVYFIMCLYELCSLCCL